MGYGSSGNLDKYVSSVRTSRSPFKEYKQYKSPSPPRPRLNSSSPVPVPRRRGRRFTLNDASLSCNRNDLRLNRKQSVSPETNDRSYSEWNIPSLVKSKLDMSVSSLEDSMRSIKETETG